MSDQSFQYKAGLNSVGSYQISGIPYASASVTVPDNTSSLLVVEFPYITKEVVIRNKGSSTIHLGFSENGLMSSSNYVPIAYGESFSATVRVKDIFLISETTSSSTIDIFATLTGIERNNLYSNWSGSIGVG